MKLKNKFVVIIPVYNAENNIQDCLQSVVNQDYDDLGIIVRDDLSTDSTPTQISNLLGIDGKNTIYSKYKNRDVLFLRNEKKFFGGGNTYDSVLNLVENKEAIIGVVDGDDKLIHPKALEKITAIYEKSNMWLVWSQHIADSKRNIQTGFSKSLPKDEVIYQSREYWSVSHFRTCKAWLFHEISIKDLEDPFNKNCFSQYACDAAFIYPITEICGNRKSFFLDEPLYYYNDNLPTNEHCKNLEKVQIYSEYVRNKKRRYNQKIN